MPFEILRKVMNRNINLVGIYREMVVNALGVDEIVKLI